MLWSKNKLKSFEDDFLIRLSEMCQNGFTQYEAIQFLFSQYDEMNESVKNTILETLSQGMPLSECLKALNYNNHIVMQVHFSERFGNVNDTLKHCYDFNISKRKLKQQFIKTIQYPLVLIGIFIGLIITINQTVLPQFKSMYDSMGVRLSHELVILTQLLYFLPHLILYCCVMILIILIYYLVIFKKYPVEKQIKYIKRIPIIKQLYQLFITYKLSADLSFFLSNGVMMRNIISILEAQDKDKTLRYIATSINSNLLSGETLPEAIRQMNLFEHSMIQFIEHGERNSKLDRELNYYSQYVFKKFEMKIFKLIKSIQPIIFLILALLIVAMYLVIILPMLQMMEGIQ
ncbi:competence type IV pilus assembly protein ComGB [Macrococcoides caseolyticum]|uniref:competence type IV pilus assembly protein ComGB n=1 Tax=Macrococcoides caseolyticum TaxID=69966 RepID=UPI001F1DC8A2|nr:competence type IV pilus assembly protein ComGB [Macrococcus caseolyticus]MCE4956109.1 type II secretion system F family protein [Macrococcus caseolyticus]